MGKTIASVLFAAALAVGCATSVAPPIDFDSGTTTPDAAACTSTCDGKCVDLKSDDANCGKCGTACAMGSKCVQGTCQCDASASMCSGKCVDLKADPANCGTCGTVCGADSGAPMGGGSWGCVNGACAVVCPMGKLECGGACVDPKTDDANCGMCGKTCVSMTETCTEGMCCKPGEKVCSAMCTDVMADAKNCGTCGNVCPMNTPSCSNGTCVASTFVQIFPPTGTAASAASVWSARYYTLTFATTKTILAVEWMATLAANDTIRAGIWNPQNQQKLATGSVVNGNGALQYHRSTLNFVAQANTPYIVGVYMSNANTVFPRKNSPTYPFTTNGITVSACWSTTTTNTDVFPTSTNSWGPDFRLEIQ